MKESNKRIKKSLLYNSIGTFTYLFCQWIITFLVVWIAGYETAGILSLAMSISNTYCVIATFNMRNYQSSDLKNNFSEKTYIYSRILTCFIALLFTLIYSISKSFSLYQILCIMFYMIFKLSEALVDVIHGSLQKKWKFDIIGKSYFYRGIISVLSFSVILYLTKNILLSIISMSLLTYIFIYFYDIKNYNKEIKKYGESNYKKIIKLLLFCVPLVLYGFIFNYVSMYPKIMVENMYGTTMLGYYSSVATPALIIQVAASFIFSPLVSYFAELYNEDDIKQLKRSMFLITLLIFCLGIVGVLVAHYLSDFILGLLYGKSILAYAYLFKSIVIVSSLIAIIWFLGTILTVIRDYKTLLFGSVTSLICTILISKSLLIKYNLIGINYILLISFSLQIIIYFLSILNIKKGHNRIYYIRSTSIINDSRASKEILSLIKNNKSIYVLGWDRDKRIKSYNNIKINNTRINGKFFKFRSSYGESLKNIIGLFLFQIWLLLKLIIDSNKYEYIHACDFDCGFVSLIVAKLFNKKLVYDMYDYYSDSRNMSPTIEKIIKKLENSIINNSNISIICGEWRKKQIKGTYPQKLLVIHNTPDIKNMEFTKVIKSTTKKVKIVYVGILQDNRLILEMINAIKKMRDYELHIGGFGKYEREIKYIAQKEKNIYFYGSLTYNEVLNLEKDCDLLIAAYNPKVKNHKYSAPNKVYEAMALEKPIIVCKNTGIDELVEKNLTGICIEYNEDSLIKELNKIKDKKDLLKEYGKKAKNLYKEKYNWQKMEEILIKAYNDLEKR